ncbi:MAG: class I SAM-dependent methyltransferase [Piscirickettsiaceae bacterium]|nr:class I SAM-dependent methyltransferase [Piscirickettsiaceae bacterium]
MFRPTYPKELFSYLASLSKQHQTAWDCGTGTGQSAIALSKYYAMVIATDASETQINGAKKKQGITYHVATAENSDIETCSIDLITVAQAFHWFNIEQFSKEAKRVLKDKGILAIWSYNLLSIQDDIDKEISYLYNTILGEYWPEERKMVEDGYKSVQLPFKEIETPLFTMSANWNLSQLIGYLYTWSATKEYQKNHEVNPVEKVVDKIANIWGKPEEKLSVQWPLNLRLWQAV